MEGSLREAHGIVRREDRERANGHPGALLWLTGLSGAGKTTLARALEATLFGQGCQVVVLDGDEVRHGLNRDLGFSREDRAENIRRVGEVGRLLAGFGTITILALISPYRADRDRVRAACRPGEFIEVFVDCDLATCEARDPKGLYAKARRGEIPDFTGISAPYETPLNPELVVRTATLSREASIAQILTYLGSNGFLGTRASEILASV